MKNRHRNYRKSQKVKLLRGRTFYIALIIASLLVMVVLNIVADTRCTQVCASIGEKEKRLTGLDKELKREITKWAKMTTEDSLDRALLKNGLKMRVPLPAQVIRMDDSGVPKHGQQSVEMALRRLSGTMPVASNTPRRRQAVRRR